MRVKWKKKRRLGQLHSDVEEKTKKGKYGEKIANKKKYWLVMNGAPIPECRLEYVEVADHDFKHLVVCFIYPSGESFSKDILCCQTCQAFGCSILLSLFPFF